MPSHSKAQLESCRRVSRGGRPLPPVRPFGVYTMGNAVPARRATEFELATCARVKEMLEDDSWRTSKRCGMQHHAGADDQQHHAGYDHE